MDAFPLRSALVLYLYSHPSPLISWMASSKKTLLRFIAQGRATGGNTNKFIRTYPDYPPAVCFQLTHEITELLETQSSLLFTDHVAIGRHILLLLWKPIRSSRSKIMYVYLCVQQHFFTLQICESEIFGYDITYARAEKLPPFSGLIQKLSFP